MYITILNKLRFDQISFAGRVVRVDNTGCPSGGTRW